MPKDEVLGWWFSEGKTLPHGDGRRIQIGRTHRNPRDRFGGIDPTVIPCRRGFHLSRRPMDALKYAPGPIVWRVRGSGTMVRHSGDKFAFSERTYLAGGIDASEVLRAFARKCALDVIHLWDAPKIVVRFLRTGDESIRDAARDAARDATRVVAWNAAQAAAQAAAWDAARDKQNRRLTAMLFRLINAQ